MYDKYEGFSDFLDKINFVKEKISPIDLTIPKGYAIIWDSSLIHGASPILNQSFSRKSITAHYSPIIM